jgi:hypothetical protein
VLVISTVLGLFKRAHLRLLSKVKIVKKRFHFMLRLFKIERLSEEQCGGGSGRRVGMFY